MHERCGQGGVLYSQAYTREWLRAEGLHTLIRSHQVVRTGAERVDCGEGCSLWTVFSASNYPNHTGLSDGAVLRFEDCDLRRPRILRYRTDEPDEPVMDETGVDSRSVATLSELIAGHRHQLSQRFTELGAAAGLRRGRVRVVDWVDAMGEVLQLEMVDWAALQPSLAPTIQRLSQQEGQQQPTLVPTDEISYEQFMRVRGSPPATGSPQTALPPLLGSLYGQAAKMEALFRELDLNGDGVISASEFRQAWQELGVAVEASSDEVDRVFEAMDHDGRGFISRNEFFEVLRIGGVY